MKKKVFFKVNKNLKSFSINFTTNTRYVKDF